MGALENIKLLLDLVANLEGLRRDMRRNAQGYKDNLAAGRPLIRVAEIARQDANEYRRRLDWHRRFDTPGLLRNKLLDGLARLNVPIQETLTAWQQLSAAADTLAAAPMTTDAELVLASDALLATVDGSDTLWE